MQLNCINHKKRLVIKHYNEKKLWMPMIAFSASFEGLCKLKTCIKQKNGRLPFKWSIKFKPRDVVGLEAVHAKSTDGICLKGSVLKCRIAEKFPKYNAQHANSSKQNLVSVTGLIVQVFFHASGKFVGREDEKFWRVGGEVGGHST
ncbi:hypothetical protein HELRODRAFT_163935 [Helobdella robusta]|uniref:Uncharacterized protein n=1 Tax=Helobdella robusta TaxID=6412 RepID=T1EUM7_HELRO|nr:hypothetical protein HELRODRAFT_163935 [Helobdella robusta]ESN94154.1 hypothetical protein HELRODRAFT_163935 [Helobdella robusta]